MSFAKQAQLSRVPDSEDIPNSIETAHLEASQQRQHETGHLHAINARAAAHARSSMNSVLADTAGFGLGGFCRRGGAGAIRKRHHIFLNYMIACGFYICCRNNLGGFDGAVAQAQVANSAIITAPAIYESSGATLRVNPRVCLHSPWVAVWEHPSLS